MNTNYFDIAKYVLPTGILDYFEVTSVETKDSILYIELSEKKAPPSTESKLHSKGFYPNLTLTDFPVRDKELVLLVRRRKWEDLQTGKLVKRDWDLACKGSKYTEEFGAFLKAIHR